MKTLHSFLFLFLLVSTCSFDRYEGPENISCQQAFDLIQKFSGDSSFVILDPRPQAKYNAAHIADAIYHDVFADDFDAWLNGLDKNNTYLVYCTIGHRSSIVMTKMKKAGFKNLYHLHEGIREWIKQGFPVIDENNL